ncbi:NAD(P)-dependent oxidoreductase [Microbacterium murale]|uniref:Dehydrogenase n=1 Tax=Microbacterium murale TaxID=1081040 RepID=A0ABQ1S4C7_9MICO|nr:NAD(P)-dependent oxidoreductase [Microbacterium murale]GGD89124.1 dehydrogenase [Microbacterium murale]
MALPNATIAIADPQLSERLASFDHLDLVPFNSDAIPDKAIDVMVRPLGASASWLRTLRGHSIRLVQGAAVGTDGVEANLPPEFTYANGRSAQEASTAEFALLLALAMERCLPQYVRDSMEGRWAPGFGGALLDRRVLVLGYGQIGKRIASLFRAHGSRVEAVASRRRHGEDVPVYGVEEFPERVRACEILVICLPLQASTTRIVSSEILASMPPESLVVNVGRGGVMDYEAVRHEAAAGRLRFALDVTDPEPLPSDDSLFIMPNVLITPHVAGATDRMLDAFADLIAEQARRLVSGRIPLNIVFSP